VNSRTSSILTHACRRPMRSPVRASARDPQARQIVGLLTRIIPPYRSRSSTVAGGCWH
jgi:hypothetical protein